MQVRLNGYSNPTGRCQDCPIIETSPKTLHHSCCDDHSKADCSGDERCDSYFIYCLRPLNFGVTRLNPCGYPSNGSKMSSFFNRDDAGISDFSQLRILGLNNPLTLSGLGYSYVVSH